MEAAIYARVLTLSEPNEIGDAEYAAGLRMAIREALDLGIASIELGPEWNPPPPPALAIQAQRAARTGVPLDTVLRRYATGDRIVGEFIVEEADRFPGQAVGQVMKTREPVVDGLMAHAATQYMREFERLRQSPEQRRTEIVEKLLGGDVAVDPSELEYAFDSWHLAAILVGDEAAEAAPALAQALGSSSLVVPRGPRTVWLWLGGRKRIEFRELERVLDRDGRLSELSFAVGESRRGLDGWRLSHEEACAGHQILLRAPKRLVRGADVVLLAAVLRDDSLARSLLQTYLAPLDGSGSSGEVLRRTLRAYFASGRNAATAAAALEVDRHTVQRRLRKVEALLGRQLNECQAELGVALDLEELGGLALLDDAVAEPEPLRLPHFSSE